ncbi:MAG: hypothetical protein SNF93_02515 [Rikenellaceae bacterium]
MKKFYCLLLLLFAAHWSYASTPVSYRFGIDAGFIGSGYGIMVSPMKLQIGPALQVGLFGLGGQNLSYQSSYDDVFRSASEVINYSKYSNFAITDVKLRDVSGRQFDPVLQMASVKYNFTNLSLGDKFMPFVNASLYWGLANNNVGVFNNEQAMNVSNVNNVAASRLMGDVKVGMSLYSSRCGSNLSAYLGATYGTYTYVNNEYTAYYSGTYNSKTVEDDTIFYDCGTVQLPVQFSFGLQFEFGTTAAFGYPSVRVRSGGSFWDKLLVWLNFASAAVSIANDAYAITHPAGYNSSSSTQTRSEGTAARSSSSSSRSSSSNDENLHTSVSMRMALNRDREVYNKLESSISKMSTDPSYYNYNNLRKYQSEMKAIREKWQDKTSFRKSKWESWNR